jgi:chromosome segregation ATPase
MKALRAEPFDHSSPRIGPLTKSVGKKSAANDNATSKPATSDTFMNSIGNIDEPSTALSKLSFLERDIERRQESYIARERAYKARIEELEDEVNILKESKTEWMIKDTKISKLRLMQTQILGNIEIVQDRTARILQEQERDLLKAFRARLYDVQTELEKEKSRKDDGTGAWIDRCNTLTSELEWSKSVADRLERVNQALMQDNSRLKSEYASQEEDRNFIIAQLVAVKKENARLRAEYSALESELASAKQKVLAIFYHTHLNSHQNY